MTPWVSFAVLRASFNLSSISAATLAVAVTSAVAESRVTSTVSPAKVTRSTLLELSMVVPMVPSFRELSISVVPLRVRIDPPPEGSNSDLAR